MGNLFTNNFLKNLQLCLADAGWRTVNPYVKQWVRAKSNEVYADLADDVSQMGQPFSHTADEFFSESMLVIKNNFIKFSGLKDTKYATKILNSN